MTDIRHRILDMWKEYRINHPIEDNPKYILMHSALYNLMVKEDESAGYTGRMITYNDTKKECMIFGMVISHSNTILPGDIFISQSDLTKLNIRIEEYPADKMEMNL